MEKNRRIIFRMMLILTGLLIFLCVFSAFLGASKSEKLFNSTPMSVFWFMFEILLLGGFIFFKRLRSNPGMFLTHLGVILIIGGSMYGSRGGHLVLNSLTESNKVKRGRMVVYQGASENMIIKEGEIDGVKLDFSIRLKRFYIDYYWPGEVVIQFPGGEVISIAAVAGAKAEIGETGTVSIVGTYDNFKLGITDKGRAVFDEKGSADNPAVEVRYEGADGSSFDKYVFARFNQPQKKGHFNFSYKLPIKEYTSEVEVIEDGVKVKEAEIEVNEPLHYGGYYFYQSSYDAENLSYTVLSVSSDSGVFAAFAGFIAMGAGIFWCCWFSGKTSLQAKKERGRVDGN